MLRDTGSAQDVARRRERLLEQAEAKVEEATAAAMRQFLRRVQRRVTPAALTAASSVPRPTRLFEVGEAAGWWQEAVDEHVTQAVADVWRDGYFDTRDGELLRSSQAAIGDHLANVTDRLSRTATPTVPDQAMDKARVALAEETARGSSIRDTSQRLAAEFGWDEDAGFWRDRVSDVDGRIDGMLDPIGPPGDAAREHARLNDPAVRQLQAERANARQHIDRVESEWQVRSERIARTETTGAYNAGSVDAAHVERAGVKVWIATGDDRTRDEHLAAAGQCVAVDDAFDVGGVALEMPADPSGPPELTVNCRCTLVFADTCEEAGQAYGDVDRVMDEERQRRGVDAPEDPAVEPLTVDPEVESLRAQAERDRDAFGGDLFADDEEVRDRFARAAWDQDITLRDGRRMQTRVDFAGSDQISGTVFDADSGNQVGHFARRMRTTNEGQRVVQHDFLRLDETVQGQGLASSMNHRAEAYYRASGVDAIELTAAGGGDNVGGYAWARAGYNWDPKVTPRVNLDGLELARSRTPDEVWNMATEMSLEDLPNQLAWARTPAGRQEIASVVERLAGDNPPTPFEISELGRAAAAPGETWFGKRAMMGTTWKGVKWLQ